MSDFKPFPTRILISDLCDYLECYLPEAQIREIYHTYLFGAEAHEGQQRKSGEPYIYHPIAVARILAEMRMDHKCIMAALLHDVLEDTDYSKEQLAEAFDEEIAELVDGVSKLARIDFKSRADAQAASLQKMLLAMAKDIRVILIKLADRLHNMRTLSVMPPAKSRRISKETLEIYAPIAQRLGMQNLHEELEDLSFAHYWPWRYRILKQAVEQAQKTRAKRFAKVEAAIAQRLQEVGMEGKIRVIRRNLYSIYREMRASAGKQRKAERKRNFSEIMDTLSLRIIVSGRGACYRALGCTHDAYLPVAGKFQDHIAIPKSNGHQFLYTELFGGTQVQAIRVQLCTESMERVLRFGIASHWMDQSRGISQDPPMIRDWIQTLLELQRNSENYKEFYEHIKREFLPDEIYVFTPKGEIRTLPKGATVLDFAYAIHSDVGNHCVAARVDRIMQPLQTPLHNGQTVEIISAPGAIPSAAWLSFVVTGKARAAIRAYLKNLKRREAEELGRRLLQNALKQYGQTLDDLPEESLQAYLRLTRLPDLAKLLVEIGMGNRLPALVAARLILGAEASVQLQTDESTQTSQLTIQGTEGITVRYPQCCLPIPGDPIIGLFYPGQGILVHRQNCKNLGEFQQENRLALRWAHCSEATFSTAIRVEIQDRSGALAEIARNITEADSNIESVRSYDKDGTNLALDFQISVRDRDHLARILRRLRKLPFVLRIQRKQN